MTPEDPRREILEALAVDDLSVDEALTALDVNDRIQEPGTNGLFGRLTEQHKPGDPHQYRLTCEVCGESGTIRLTIDPGTFLGETHRCNCPESGTSGFCPFHDNGTIRAIEPED
jgi:hypothetical protein